MIQKKIENMMNKNPPFLLTKEKKIRFLTQKDNKSEIPTKSLSNTKIIKINSCNNLDSNSKDKTVEPIKEGTNQASSMEPGVEYSTRRWTKEEHNKFLQGIIEYGNNWKMVEKVIKTRSSSEARSHALKYFIYVKKNILRQTKIINDRNLLNTVLNCIKNFKGGQPLDEIQKKRTLNLLISNFQNFGKDEIESCNMVVNETKSISSQKNGDKYIFYEKEFDKNRVSGKNNILIEIKENCISKNNSYLENKNNIEGNKIEFCNKKRKNSWIGNKIFNINKVTKYKYSNNFNKINGNSNKQTLEKLKKPNNIICPIINNNFTDITNNYNNIISNNSINSKNNYKININSKNNNNKNMNDFINNNFKNNSKINDFTSYDENKFNFTEHLFDFGKSIRENNYFGEDEYPKFNTLESQKKLFFNGNELNDSFKNNFFEESILSLGEHIDENPFINMLFDLFE